MKSAALNKVELSPKEYKSAVTPVWCPGCGDYAVLNSAYKALSQLGLDPEQTVFVSGIGCSSRLPYFVDAYAMHTLHGRALPVAAGVKLGNPELEVIVVGGDGDGLSIGGGHFPHVTRKNTDITYIMMDNSVYGLTKCQVSPTSDLGFKTKTTPHGSFDNPINPIALALTYGATFVAQAFSGKPKDCAELIRKAIDHEGFSFVNILSPCPSFNSVNTSAAYKESTKPLPDDYTPDNRSKALEIAMGPEARDLMGVYFQERTPTLVERIEDLIKSQGGDQDY
ncbi:MAG: 2-oxoacid:ferredoxin oxidoreductase subunit beta, partial [Deltaproteobacteria bacterium]|nr:2-oxoacid:ferredoxin oxidoreductase subunit beta [Deltaproteobacteria bacterium]